MRKRQSEFVGQWRSDPAHAIWKFAKISRREDPIFQQIQEKGVHVTPHGFHCVERERIPITLVGMQHAERRTHAEIEQCEPRF